MSIGISQEPRLLSIETTTGKEFVLRRLEATEAISRPFLIQVEVLSEDHAVKGADVIGHTAAIAIERGPTEQPRYFHGVIAAFRRIGRFGTRYSSYGLEIVPSFWNLSRKSNCRVFQNESVPSIVKKVIGEGGAAAPAFMSADETPRPYCLQFNETDLEFCQRLMDETGCGYYWLHASNEHTMLVASSNADFFTLSSGPYNVTPGADHWDSLTGFSLRAALEPGAVRAMDYNLIKPSNLFDTTTKTVLTEVQNDAGYEMFHWPGGQHVKPDANPALYAMQSFEAEADIARATGHDPAVLAGCKITVRPDPLQQATQNYVLTRVIHSAYDETQITEGGGFGYSSSLTMIPENRTFRPPAPRPRPVVPGLQSAIVVGPKNEEIHTDAYGRIKIRFLWDRVWPVDDTACEIWVRVAQPFAGKWGGTFFLPRIGDEVLVGFVDGDPDKPVVVGSLYNEDAPPPFPMPSKKEQGGFSTRSSKKGGSSNANILRFDDTKGSEEFFIQAERNMNVLVKNARTETINVGNFDGDDTYTLKKGDKWMTLGEGDWGSWVEKGDQFRVVGEGDDAVFIEKGDRSIVVREGDSLNFVEKGDYRLQVGEGDVITLVDKGDVYTGAKSNITTKSDTGNIAVTASAGKIEMTAATSIELKVGGSSIKLDPSGITIKAPQVKINADMLFEAKGGMKAAVEGGMMTEIKGGALTIIKGGFVLIN